MKHNLLFTKLPGDPQAHEGLRGTGLKYEWESAVHGKWWREWGRPVRPISGLWVEMPATWRQWRQASVAGARPDGAGGMSREALSLGLAMGWNHFRSSWSLQCPHLPRDNYPLPHPPSPGAVGRLRFVNVLQVFTAVGLSLLFFGRKTKSCGFQDAH